MIFHATRSMYFFLNLIELYRIAFGNAIQLVGKTDRLNLKFAVSKM